MRKLLKNWRWVLIILFPIISGYAYFHKIPNPELLVFGTNIVTYFLFSREISKIFSVGDKRIYLKKSNPISWGFVFFSIIGLAIEKYLFLMAVLGVTFILEYVASRMVMRMAMNRNKSTKKIDTFDPITEADNRQQLGLFVEAEIQEKEEKKKKWLKVIFFCLLLALGILSVYCIYLGLK